MKRPEVLTLFLCGDVMTGRGIDQILPHPGNPVLYESSLQSALGYLELAEKKNGRILRPVDFSYVWGDALDELELVKPHVRIVNLETSITVSEDWEDKGINYRMHPANTSVLTAAGIDVCVLANNHVLDWGERGLRQTLSALHEAGVKTAGAGLDEEDAVKPAIVDLQGQGRLLIFSLATSSSGVPPHWAARDRPGINLLKGFDAEDFFKIQQQIQSLKTPKDLVMVSMHWGGNWGYGIPEKHVSFARSLIDDVGIDLVHGHSSHHVLGIEVYREKLIIYGCGDFINDYEGIWGYEKFRGDLAVMFFPHLEVETGKLQRLRLVVMQMKKFHLVRASLKDVKWLKEVLNREGLGRGTSVEMNEDHSLELKWKSKST
ncbi:CapA family protein [Bdellovibrio sp.]|uniref:CapA family protein n=1 Tax=Bdellovibrio sp. TaxID=28201 RepID=UPI0039E5948F